LPRFALPKLRYTAVVAVSVSIVVGSYFLAVSEESFSRQFAYTEFWMLPTTPGKLIVGVKSGENGPATYDIRVTDGNRLLANWTSIQLDPNDPPWTKEVDFQSGSKYHTVKAILYRDSNFYRRTSAIVLGD
jgi:hypothetical protein